MRFLTASLLVVCVGLISTARANAQWTEAKIPNEQDRTVQGCAEKTRNPGDWVCVFVRCDQPGSPPGVHFSTPGPDIQGDIKLVIDDDSFSVSVPASPRSPLALSTRADAVSAYLIEALKAGTALSIEGTDLKPPFNRISLQNSRMAIERIERTCARSHSSAARFWQRIRSTVGLF